jgi:hypothetical protein
MHLDLNLLGPLIGLAATIIGGWLGHRIASPKDHDKAALLTRIAEETAAAIYAANPSAVWADLLRDTINRLAGAAGLPTTNAVAIENAATAALLKLRGGPTQAAKPVK